MKLARRPLTTATGLPEIQDELGRLMDQFLFTSGFPLPTYLTERDWSPSLDFSETPTDYVVRLEAPGVAKEDMDIKLDGQMLTIQGKRSLNRESKDEKFVWREREEGSFLRSLRMPLPVNDAKVDAKVEHGVVTITLPKKETAVSTHIPLK